MTDLNVTHQGRTVTYTAIQLVEEAFQECGLDPSKLEATFIPYWLSQGKTIDEILVIAGEQPRKRNDGAAA